MQNDFGLISIIMAAYNAEKTIEQEINSVLSQTYPDFELLVVNDCSTDKTAMLAEAIVKKDDRVRLISNEKNSGVSYTRKHGLEEASGEWVAILDSDDAWAPEKLEKQINLQKKTNADLLFTGSAFMDADGKPIDWYLAAPAEVTYRQLLKQNVLSNSSALVRKELYAKYYAVGDGMHEDFALWLNILKDGRKAYGLINYASSFTSFFSTFCVLGINSVIVKNFIDHPNEEGKTTGSAIGVRMISSICSVVLIMVATLFLDREERTTHLVVLLLGLGAIPQVFDTLNYWFQAKLESKYAAIASAIGYTVMMGYKISLLVFQKNVVWFAAASSIEYLVVAVCLYYNYRRHGGPSLSFSWRKVKELLNSSHHFILVSLMVSIYGSTDKLMLKQMMDETEVGFYSTAVTVCGLWCFILAAINDSMYPVILEAFESDIKLFERKCRQLYAIVFYTSAGVSILYTMFAKYIILILYGEAYLPAITPMRIVTWYIAFSYLGDARNVWVISYDCQKYLKYLYIGSAITNVVMNYFLIPLFGASGAAFASVVTQISTIMIFPLFIRKMRPNVKLMLDAICLKDVF